MRKNLSDRDRGQSLRSLGYLWHYLRPYRKGLAGALAALTVTSGAVLAIGHGLRFFIDQGFAADQPGQLAQAAELLVGIIIVLALGSFARFYFISWVGERVVADIRRDVYRHVIRLEPAFFESMRTGEVISRLVTDTTLLQMIVGGTLAVALRNMLLLLGGAALLFFTSPRLTGIVFSILPFVVVPIIVIGRRVRVLSRETQDRVADLSAQTEETLYAIRTIQSFTQEKTQTEMFGHSLARLLTAAQRRIFLRALLTAIVILLIFGSITCVLWIGGKDVMEGRLSSGELSAFIFYAVVVAGAVGSISEIIGELYRAAGAAERLIELLRVRPAISCPPEPLILPEPVQGEVVFEHVGFSYPTRPDRSTLTDFSLQVSPGECVALVGPSGAGKSTLFQLLLRFYDPQEGEIRLDGFPLQTLDPAALRRHIALVPQDPVIFHADAWTNIRFGMEEAEDEAVIEAAQVAAAADFLSALPEGFATPLGERGVTLSGGQKQRVAIARAVLRNPSVLLLDEATSALDAENERLVQAALERVMEGRTTFIIAHRLATVLKADRIAVMDEGRIEAIGTHEELLETSALYARLARLQFAQGYAEA